MSYFSNNLKYLREKRKLSQNKLAEMAGVNQTTIARWETEEVSPSLDNIYDLAESLNVSIAELTGRDLSVENNTTSSNNDDNIDALLSAYKDLPDTDKEWIKNMVIERRKLIDKQLENKGA